jgi:putative holliday junction resolvase
VRIAGLDVGEKTIGVALSDPLGLTAQGLEVIRRRAAAQDLARLSEIARLHAVERWVVGLPRNMNGTYGPGAAMARSFAEQLRDHSGLPVELWDERLTTAAAERTLLEADLSRRKRRQVIDKLAAAYILQGYLDAGRGRGEPSV